MTGPIQRKNGVQRGSEIPACLDPVREPRQEARETCAEGLLASDPKQAVPTLWQALRRTTTPTPAEKAADHGVKMRWQGSLVGILLTYGHQQKNKALIRSAEKYLGQDGPDGNWVRSTAIAYLIQHPAPALEKYVIFGLHADPQTRDHTALFIRGWPYSPTMTTAILDAYERATLGRKVFLAQALGRMKAREALPLFRRELGLTDHPGVREEWLRVEVAKAMSLDLKDPAGIPILKTRILDRRVQEAERVTIIRRLGFTTTPDAKSALLALLKETAPVQETSPATIRCEVALALHIHWLHDEEVVKAVEPVFEAAAGDDTLSSYLKQACRTHLEQIRTSK